MLKYYFYAVAASLALFTIGATPKISVWVPFIIIGYGMIRWMRVTPDRREVEALYVPARTDDKTDVR